MTVKTILKLLEQAGVGRIGRSRLYLRRRDQGLTAKRESET